MLRTRFIRSCLMAVSLTSALAQPSSGQSYSPDDDENFGLPSASRRHATSRDSEAFYPSSADEDYGTARSPTPYDPSLYPRGGYSSRRRDGSAPGGDRTLRADERQTTKQVIEYPTSQPVGTIVIDTRQRKLFYVVGGGQALAYGIGVGREGFAWKGLARVGRKAEWPAWIPPAEMIRRRPELPERMEGGIANPLGARALYLYQGNADTLFRIHGTNEPETIGQAVSSGCIRMLNGDVVDLYERIPVGTKVVVI